MDAAKKKITLILINILLIVSILTSKTDASNYDAETYLYLQKNLFKALNEFDRLANNKDLFFWLPYQIDLTLPGDIIDDQGRNIIQVYLTIDPDKYHKKIEHKEKLLDSVILIQDQVSMDRQIKISINKVMVAYQGFIETNIKNGFLVKPSSRLMDFYFIFKGRLFELLRGEFNYNNVLGWKFYFPEEKNDAVSIEFETINYKKTKIFETRLEEDSQGQINSTYKLVEEVINWLHATLREGLDKNVLKIKKWERKPL